MKNLNLIALSLFLFLRMPSGFCQSKGTIWCFEKDLSQLKTNDTIYSCSAPQKNYIIFKKFNSHSKKFLGLECNKNLKESYKGRRYYFKKNIKEDTFIVVRFGLRALELKLLEKMGKTVLVVQSNTYLD